MSLQLVDKEDCSHKGGMRKTDRIKLEDKKITKFHRMRPTNITYVDPILGIVRVKNILYNKTLNGWLFRLGKDDKISCNNVECNCFDRDGDKERTYIIPKDEIVRDSFLIRRNIKIEKWYDKYKVKKKE